MPKPRHQIRVVEVKLNAPLSSIVKRLLELGQKDQPAPAAMLAQGKRPRGVEVRR